MKKVVNQVFICGITLSLFLVSALSVRAQKTNGTISIAPAYDEVSLEKNAQEKTLTFELKNNSDKPIELEMFPIDFKQADATGIVTFLGNEGNSYSYSLSSFLSFESDRVALDPGEQKKFLVKVKNREDLSPGGHYAAIVAKLSDQDKKPADAYIAPSVSALVLLRKVGGERYNLSLIDSNWPSLPVVFSYPRRLQVTFQNEGNVHVVPYGVLTVTDMFGRHVEQGIVNTSSLFVLPESRRFVSVDLSSLKWNLPVSFNSMTIKGDDSHHKAHYTYQASFIYVSPWCGLILLLPIGVIWWLRKRKQV